MLKQILFIQTNAPQVLPAMQPNVTTQSEAAEEKNCGRTTIWRAVKDGRLNTAEVGGRDMILRDETFRQFEPRNTGRRAARSNAKEN